MQSNNLESVYQKRLIHKLKKIFPNAFVLKMNQRQGIPDLLILNDDKWATLECKRNSKSSIRPNQLYYVSKMNDMSYSNFIYPENEEVILNELQQALST